MHPLLATDVTFDWVLSYVLGTVVVAAVVVLLIFIYALATSISEEAVLIDQALEQAVVNTSALPGLNTTINHAEVIVAGLYRGRKRLGG